MSMEYWPQNMGCGIGDAVDGVIMAFLDVNDLHIESLEVCHFEER